VQTQNQDQLIRYPSLKGESGCYTQSQAERESRCHGVTRKATVVPGHISINIACKIPECILLLSATDIRHCTSRKIKTMLPKLKERQKKNGLRKIHQGRWNNTGLRSLAKGWERSTTNCLPVTEVLQGGGE